MFSNKKNSFIFSFSLLFFSLGFFMKVSANTAIVNNDIKTISLQGVVDTNNWVKLKNVWYCFDSTGKIKTGWIKDNNRLYRLDGQGKMQTGWNYIENSWYHFDNKTGRMTTGWLNDNSKWYYLNVDGTLAISTTIDGYNIDKNGVLVK